ncbi:hypothetical protein [Haloarcula sediminis]|uniref:hypothetical protein n=1 Tax=Haloarcula sediminis TaxID=3111777 RepID=UPI002D7721E0|nr:hypothetical protein [Haloarcula sp. CK38]
MSSFDFHGLTNVKIQGAGPLADYFQKLYSEFKTDEVSNSAVDFHCTVVDEIEYSPDATFGAPLDHFAQKGDDIYYRSGNTIIEFTDGMYDQIVCEKNSHPRIPQLLLEFKIRESMLEHDYIITHASSVVYKGETFVFPAWRHTGKTNTILSLLQDGAEGYLSDDRVFLSKKESIKAFPTPIHLLSYNLKSFPELSDFSSVDRYRNCINERINTIASSRDSILLRGLKLISNTHLAKTDWTPAAEMFNCEIVEKTNFDKLIFLETHPEEEVSIRKYPSKKAFHFLRAVNYQEWNSEIQDIIQVLELVSDSNSIQFSNVSKFVKKETELARELVENTDTYVLEIPEEEKWNKSLKSKLITKIQSI